MYDFVNGSYTPSITRVDTLENITVNTILCTLINTLASDPVNHFENSIANVPVRTLLNTLVYTLL